MQNVRLCGRTVTAEAALETGDVVLHVPVAHLLLQSSTLHLVLHLYLHRSPLFILPKRFARPPCLVALPQESCTTPPSEPVVSTLPDSFDTFLWHPDVAPFLPLSVRHKMSRIDADMLKCRTWLKSRLPPGCPFDQPFFSYCWWAVNTRCLAMPDSLVALAPGFDMLNHSISGQNARIHTANDGVYVYATRHIPAHAEIFIKYGEHDDTILAVDYFFPPYI